MLPLRLLPNLSPPKHNLSVVGWIKTKLFYSPQSIVLTLVSLYLLYLVFTQLWQWAIWDANFAGDSHTDCNLQGACWVFIKVHFGQLLYGQYPSSEYWRVNLSFVLLIATIITLSNFKMHNINRIILCLIYAFMAAILLKGGIFDLPTTEIDRWGGIFLTLVITIISVSIAFVIGIFLALGRQSKLHVIKFICITFIETVRGVPLITILFLASTILPLLFLPEINIEKLFRAIIGISLFQAAYFAEAIRGGLQSIPKGQYEAAQSLGFSYWRKTFFIILPQGLIKSIPSIVSAIITLFKDTTLVTVIGLADFLTIGFIASQNPKWLGNSIEVYVFCACIYLIICFGISSYSLRLEKKLSHYDN